MSTLVTDALPFPSLDWFKGLAALMNENESAFRRIGPADVVWAFEIGPSGDAGPRRVFRLVFEDYGCVAVDEVDAASPSDATFTLRARYDTWKEMIENIQVHGQADRTHTINTLTLPDDPVYVQAPDFLARDVFARYGQTFQKFFDGAARLPTAFPDTEPHKGVPPCQA